MNIQKELFALQDLGYREFHARLMPSIDKNKIIGVRTPALRKLATSIPPAECAEFFQKLPHTFYEENNIHACLVSAIRDFDTVIHETNRFLPYIDNWATCDMFFPKVFQKNPELLLPHVHRWIASKDVYAVRFGIGCLMRLFLDDNFRPEYPQMVAAIRRDEYYIRMMVAWYFATALAKQYDAVLPYLTENRLEKWVHNKTIQKAVESYRISPDKKTFLRSLRQ